VYQFFSSFDKVTEFPIVLDEVLSYVHLSLESCTTDADIQLHLSCHSFDTFITFLNHLDVLVNQMGNLI